MSASLEMKVGGTYFVRHQRKGSFTVKVIETDGETVTGQIVDGVAGAMLADNVRDVGEEVTFRLGLCTFNEV